MQHSAWSEGSDLVPLQNNFSEVQGGSSGQTQAASHAGAADAGGGSDFAGLGGQHTMSGMGGMVPMGYQQGVPLPSLPGWWMAGGQQGGAQAGPQAGMISGGLAQDYHSMAGSGLGWMVCLSHCARPSAPLLLP